MNQDREFEVLRVHLSLAGDPRADLEVERRMLKNAESGQSSLFLYTWPCPVLVLGHGQTLDDGQKDRCAREGVPILKRITGGTGVLRDKDLGISLALPSTHPWAASIPRLYDEFAGCVQRALRSVEVDVEKCGQTASRSGRGSPICFENRAHDSLLALGKKVLGCAQVRTQTSVMIHGMLLLELDTGLQSRVFGVPKTRIRAAMTPVYPRDGLPALGVALIAEISLGLEKVPEVHRAQEDDHDARGGLRSPNGISSSPEQGRRDGFGAPPRSPG